jgi:hypothetical protein
LVVVVVVEMEQQGRGLLAGLVAAVLIIILTQVLLGLGRQDKEIMVRPVKYLVVVVVAAAQDPPVL